jgi:hypothetical protein
MPFGRAVRLEAASIEGEALEGKGYPRHTGYCALGKAILRTFSFHAGARVDPRPVLKDIDTALDEQAPVSAWDVVRQPQKIFRLSTGKRLTLRQLQALRDKVDDAGFERSILEYYATINDPDVADEILSLLRRLKRRLQEAREDRVFEREMLNTVGIGGGVGLFGVGVAAILAVGFPIVALVPIFGGIVMVAVGTVAAHEVSRQRVVIEQVEARVGAVLERLENE